MTDRWLGALVVGAFGVALALCLNVLVGCSNNGDKGSPSDGAVATDATTATDSGGGSDAPGTDAGGLSDAPPPPDASAPDGAATD